MCSTPFASSYVSVVKVSEISGENRRTILRWELEKTTCWKENTFSHHKQKKDVPLFPPCFLDSPEEAGKDTVSSFSYAKADNEQPLSPDMLSYEKRWHAISRVAQK